MRRIRYGLLSIAICFTMLLNGINVSAAHQSEKLNSLHIGDMVDLGFPIKDIQILGCSTATNEDGDNIFYAVTSGPPALFFAYNIDKDKVVAQHSLETDITADNGKISHLTAKVSYAVDIGPDGIVNIATQSQTLYFRYNPKTDVMKCYGQIIHDGNIAETAVMHRGAFDSEGNYYFGTYPNAMLVRYNVKTDKLEQLKKNLVVGDYIKSMAIYNDKLYAGAYGYEGSDGSMICNFVEYDLKSGVVTQLPNPSEPNAFASDKIHNYYTMTQAGKYIIAKCKVTLKDGKTAYKDCVFDAEKKQWVDYIQSSNHLHYTDFDGDVIYASKGTSGGSALFAYNPVTKEDKQISTKVFRSTYMVSPEIVRLKDQQTYPGKTIVAGANGDGMLLYNLQTQEMTFRKTELPCVPMQIRTLEKGGQSELLLSGYMAAKAVTYHTGKEQANREYPSTQIEGIAYIDGKYYTGMYGGGAYLQQIDPAMPAVSGQNPKKMGAMSSRQDRAFVVTDGGADIIWGSVPNYGYLGGDVAFYNKSTGKTRINEQPVKNQSIAGLLYVNGKVYGSTNVHGGLNIDPIDAPAKLFCMDAATGRVEQVVDISLKTDTRRQYFAGGMTLLPDGKIAVGLQKTVAIVNPQTLAIETEIPVGTATSSILDSARWIPYDLVLAPNGLLYTNVGRQISAVDLNTKEVKLINTYSTNALELSDEGSLYFIDNKLGAKLMRIDLSEPEDIDVSTRSEHTINMPGDLNDFIEINQTGEFPKGGDTIEVFANEVDTSPIYSGTLEGGDISFNGKWYFEIPANIVKSSGGTVYMGAKKGLKRTPVNLRTQCDFPAEPTLEAKDFKAKVEEEIDPMNIEGAPGIQLNGEGYSLIGITDAVSSNEDIIHYDAEKQRWQATNVGTAVVTYTVKVKPQNHSTFAEMTQTAQVEVTGSFSPKLKYLVNMPGIYKDIALLDISAPEMEYLKVGTTVQIFKEKLDKEAIASFVFRELDMIDGVRQTKPEELPAGKLDKNGGTVYLGFLDEGENGSFQTPPENRTPVKFGKEPEISCTVPSSMTTGTTKSLTVNVSESNFKIQSVALQSSDESVLKISSGTSVKGVAGGSVTLTITASCKENNTGKIVPVSRNFSVNVTKPSSPSGGGGGGGGPAPTPKPTETPAPTPTPSPEPTGTPSVPSFSDIPEDLNWAEDSIIFLADKGIINGTGEDIFSPNENIKRGDFILLMARLFALEPVESNGDFSDVPQDSYYYEAIMSAKAEGIASGSPDGRFSPEDFITREDQAVLLARILEKKNYLTGGTDLNVLEGFSDKDQVSGYAADAVCLMIQKELIKGDGINISPKANASRAETAVLFKRIYDMIQDA